jgi:hypothetical protein
VFTVWDGKTLLEGSPTRVIQHVKQDDDCVLLPHGLFICLYRVCCFCVSNENRQLTESSP